MANVGGQLSRTRFQFLSNPLSLLGGFSSRDGRQELLEEAVVDAGPLQVHQVACLAYALQHRFLAKLPEITDPEMFQSLGSYIIYIHAYIMHARFFGGIILGFRLTLSWSWRAQC